MNASAEKIVASVLVVDDDDNKRFALRTALASLEVEVVEADSGEAALRQVMEHDFAVILLDVRMPGMNGFETAALIRRRQESELTPIIFITAYASDEIGPASRYVEGAVDCIFSPVAPDELRAKVSAFVKLYRQSASLAAQVKNVQASVEHLRSLMNSAPIGIFRTDAEARFIDTNPRWTEITGISAEQALGKDWETLLSSTEPPGRSLDDGQWTVDGHGPPGRRFEVGLEGGTSRIVTVTSEAITDSLGRLEGWVGTLADVTAEVNAESERRESTQRLAQSERMLAEGQALAHLGSFDWNIDTNELTWSDELYRILGFEPRSVEASFETLLDRVHPEDRPAFLERTQTFGDKREARLLDFRVVQGDGSVRWIHTKAEVIVDEGGAAHLIGLSQDITDRKKVETERERLEGELVQSQKMDAVGQLAGGIAHDFNNILSVILNYAQFAAEGLPAGDDRLADLREISKAGEKAARLVHQLLAFSRKELIETRVIDLNEVVTGVYEMLNRSLGEDIDLRFEAMENLPLVDVDPGRMEQVLLNLALNARDSMVTGGVLEMATGVETITTDSSSPLERGEYVCLTVTDTGTGMSAETMKRIFEPFFTTKARGEGTGMGLSSACGIVEQAGGYLSVESELGIGSTFTVHLPCADARLDEGADELPPPDAVGGGETILLVEDEDAVRGLVARILKKNGYNVIPYSNGSEALDYCATNVSGIDLLLTDVVMPRMSGKELSEKAMMICEGLQTLFMSGYTDALIAQRGVMVSGQHLITKPFKPEGLLRSVRAVLDRAEVNV